MKERILLRQEPSDLVGTVYLKEDIVEFREDMIEKLKEEMI